jgi:iron complex outermembrane receptor protein
MIVSRPVARLSSLLLAGTVLAAPFAAHAQADAGGEAEVEEVIISAPRFVPSGAITASKTTAPLIETPQSVSVVSRDQIDILNFTDVQQAVRYTAGIVGENYGPDLRFDFLTLRGFIPVQYIDGLQAPISSTISNVGIDLYGFEAIDVLKGPAGVLYGSTPPGGIYNLTSRRPSNEFSGEIQAKYGEDDFKQAAGTVTGTLADGLTARLTALYRDRDSQTDLVTAKRAYIAPTVAYQFGDTKITALAHYQWDRVEGDTNGFLPALGVLYPNPVGKVSRGVNLGEPDYNFYRRKQWGVGYELTHKFTDSIRFTQNARYGEYHEYQQIIYGSSLAADNRTVGRSNFPFKDDVEQFTIDSRFDINAQTGAIEHRILAGLDYRDYKEASAFAFAAASNIDLFNPVYSTTPIAVPTLFPFTDQRLKQTGFYVQDQAKVGAFIVTASGRQDEVKVINYAGGTRVSNKQDKFTWRLGATYVTDMGVAPYVSYATSFQPVIGQTFGGQAFKPTSSKQWEAGVKYDAANLGPDVKLFATAAVFRIEQSNVLTTDPANVNFQVQTGEVVSKGYELEAVTRIHEKLSINASYSYTDATITRSNVVAELGARLAAQPKHKASLFVDYTISEGALAGLGGGAGVRYLSNSPGNVPSAFTPQIYVTPSTTLFDATVHYDVADWRLAINASNLFDKRYAGRCNGPVGCFWGQRRQVVGTVTKKF